MRPAEEREEGASTGNDDGRTDRIEGEGVASLLVRVELEHAPLRSNVEHFVKTGRNELLLTSA